MSINFINRQGLLKISEKLLENIFKAFIFLVPSQLALHFWPKWAHVNGIRIDYLSPTVYLTDILILLILVLWLIQNNIQRKKTVIKSKTALLFFGIIILTNLLNSSVFQLSLLKWIKFIELTLLSLFIINFKKIDVYQWIVKPFLISVIFFIFIGLFQLLSKGTIGGALYFLGERNFSINTPGIALVSIANRQLLRPYSTFPHPNALAGFLGAVFFLLLNYMKLIKKEMFAFVSLLLLIGIVVTFSKTVYVVFLVCLILLVLMRRCKFNKNIGYWIFLTLTMISMLSMTLNFKGFSNKIFSSESYVQRVSLIKTTGEIFKQHQFFGVGLNNFINNILKYADDNTWPLQPVHNIYLLALAETGLIGLILMFMGIVKILKQSTSNDYFIVIILFILMTGFWDHYWITIQQNLILEFLIIGLMFRKIKDYE